MKDIQIGKHTIGDSHKPFVIAEMSGNHNQSLDRALEIVDAAAAAGAHAIKLQTYTADTMTMKGALTITDPNSLWYGRELYELYQEAYTPWDWHAPIFKRAREKGMEVFSSPFDESAVDFLMDLDVPVIKVASFENTDIPLLRKVAKTGKPVIMSTGAASLADLETGVRTLREAGCKELILLKCTSTYPATPENTNILTIPHMRELFNVHIGLSDHTMGVGVSIASVALGARVIEKHFTLGRADGGVDSAFSIEPQELKILVEESERAFLSLGKVTYGVSKVEEKSLLFKRSLFASADIQPGDILSSANVRVVRPGIGIKPKHFDQVMGKKAVELIKQGTPLSWELIG